MGQFIYELKYGYDASKLGRVVELLDVFDGIERYDLFVPIPQTNKRGPIDPVRLITEALGQRKSVAVELDNLVSDGRAELKGISDPVQRDELLRAALRLNNAQAFQSKEVILIDDLYRSGATLRAATELVYRSGQAKLVSVLTMTKTRSNR
jgi:competence protein ComFC